MFQSCPLPINAPTKVPQGSSVMETVGRGQKGRSLSEAESRDSAELHRPSQHPDMDQDQDQDQDQSPCQAALLLDFKEDVALTEMMRLRVSSLQRSGQKRQDGERLLLSYEAVYRLDFPSRALSFARWHFSLRGRGRVTVTGICQLWTPDLTHLMTRQLLEPIGTFWRSAEDPEGSPLKCLEADMQEFGERIAELAKVRKVMYFLLAFKDGAEAANLSCSLEFRPEN